jgi:CheY-like chemotaxis protein
VKILIVEDNPVNAEMVRLSLEKEQYETVLALDGEEALARLEEHPEIDLVITDVMMPNVGGLEMLERIRQRPEWKTLPVVVATSLANQATVRQAVSLHCKHFIVKPFTVKLLVQTVREAIGQRGVVLQEKTRVLGRLGLDPDGYDQLALTFSAFVHERVGALRALCQPATEEQDSAPPAPTEIDLPMRRDLFALEESAMLLGAERLANLLIALGLPNGTVAADALAGAYKALVTELELLTDALPPPPKTRKKLVDDNPIDAFEGDADADTPAADEPASS